MLEFLFNNWFLLFLFIAFAGVGFYIINVFLSAPTTEQIKKVEEWLLYGVTEAEKELGGGTGQVKLRYVYDMFITKFPFMVQKISFEAFSYLVDNVLDKFREMLESNASLKAYVEGKGNNNEK